MRVAVAVAHIRELLVQLSMAEELVVLIVPHQLLEQLILVVAEEVRATLELVEQLVVRVLL
jgi:hypothetical protein